MRRSIARTEIFAPRAAIAGEMQEKTNEGEKRCPFCRRASICISVIPRRSLPNDVPPLPSRCAASIVTSSDCGAVARSSGASATAAAAVSLGRVCSAAGPACRVPVPKNTGRGSRRRLGEASADQQSGIGHAPRSAGLATVSANQKRPGKAGALYRSTNRTPDYAAFWLPITVGPLPLPLIAIVRGFFASGISRTKSTCRRPFSRLAPFTCT